MTGTKVGWVALYQFILTTDEKPTVVYPIPDEISIRYFNRDRIYYGWRHIPGSHLGWNIYSRIFLLPGTLTEPELKLISCWGWSCTAPPQLFNWWGWSYIKAINFITYRFSVADEVFIGEYHGDGDDEISRHDGQDLTQLDRHDCAVLRGVFWLCSGYIVQLNLTHSFTLQPCADWTVKMCGVCILYSFVEVDSCIHVTALRQVSRQVTEC